MITDLANLGAPVRGTADLGVRPGAQSKKDEAAGNPESRELGKNSFDQTLKSKLGAESKKPTSPAPRERSAENAPRAAYTKPTKVGERKQETKDSVSEKNQDKMLSVVEAKAKQPKAVSSDKQMVMLEFMDSMESEFGVPPATIVEAMTNLSDADMLKTPEETAQKVISQLDLAPQDQQQAMALYLGMVAQWNSAQQKPQEPLYLATAAALPAQQLVTAESLAKTQPQDMMTPMTHQQRRAILNQNLDKMNQSFFMKNAQNVQVSADPAGMNELTTPNPMLNTEAQTLPASQFDRPLYDQGKMPGYANANDELDPFKPVPPNAGGANGANAEAMSALQAKNEEEAARTELAKGLAALGLAAGAMGEAMKADPQNAQALKMEQSMAKTDPNSAGNSAMASGLAMPTGLSTMSGEAGSESSFSDSKEESGKDLFSSKDLNAPAPSMGEFALHKELPKAAAVAGGASAGAMAMANDKAENPANLQQIVNQAQYLIKKGGGEAKIQMNQEGLGQVHLKIAVTDGKVNVQMAAETKEAKNAIESSLADLKSSLSAHKLSVDHIKVDVGNQLASDNKDKGSDPGQSQRQMDFRNEDASRDQARQFMNQFRDENSARRDFSSRPNLRGYEPSRKVEEPLKAQTAQTAAKRYSGTSKGSGLDLVA